MISENNSLNTTFSEFTLSSVQFNIVYVRSGMPRLSGVSPMLPLKQLHCWSDCRWPFLVLTKKIVERFLFLSLSPPGDRWCDFLGFVPADSVSSSSTLQIFRDATRLWWLWWFTLKYFSLISIRSEQESKICSNERGSSQETHKGGTSPFDNLHHCRSVTSTCVCGQYI